MNRSITDPHLRTFRLPLATRLRIRIDALRDLNDAQSREIRANETRIRELEREVNTLTESLDRAIREGVVLDSASHTPEP